MPHPLPANVVQVLSDVSRLLGKSFPFEALCDRVSNWRDNHPIRIEVDRKMPKEVSGYIVPLADCDLICVRPGVDDIAWLGIALHELAHLMLAHVPLCKGHPEIVTYKQFIRRRDFTVAYCRGGDSDGKMTWQNEQEAEILAAVLLRLVSEGETTFLSDFYEKDK